MNNKMTRKIYSDDDIVDTMYSIHIMGRFSRETIDDMMVFASKLTGLSIDELTKRVNAKYHH